VNFAACVSMPSGRVLGVDAGEQIHIHSKYGMTGRGSRVVVTIKPLKRNSPVYHLHAFPAQSSKWESMMAMTAFEGYSVHKSRRCINVAKPLRRKQCGRGRV